MLRRMVGVRWVDFVRNAGIRVMLNQSPVSFKFRKVRMKWFRQMQAEMQGRRLVGRPRTRWKDVFRRDLEESGLSLEETATEAQDRDCWRRIVQASCVYNAMGS